MAVGILYGQSALSVTFCNYVFKGPKPTCATAATIVNMPWNFKIIYAVLIDLLPKLRGNKYKHFMIIGWILSIGMILVTALLGEYMEKHNQAQMYLCLLLLSQVFVMIADVPADGYCVEMGKLESIEHRGQILSTAQFCRFGCSLLVGVLQICLLGGPTTNEPGKKPPFSWGLTFTQFQYLQVGIMLILILPIFLLEEPKRKEEHKFTLKKWKDDMITVFHNKAAVRLFFSMMGILSLGMITPTTNALFQYNVLNISTVLAGIDMLST